MKAVLCKSFGPPETLVVEEVAPPAPGPGEAVVAIEAVALNFFDTLIIENRYQLKPPLPFSPGAEFAGRVTAVGEGVRGLEPGAAVMGYSAFGAARQQIAVAAEKLVPVPDGLDMKLAAGLTVAYGTSYHALCDRAQLKPGETVLVLGGAGGTGQSAIEIARELGARVIAAASSADKLAFCRELGAAETIDYSREDLKERAKALTGGKGVDVVYDPVGGPLAEQALRATGWEGRFLVIGFASGEIPKIPLNLPLLKGSEIVGVHWNAFVERAPERHRANMETLIGWCAQGRIAPRIHEVFPLAETGAAIAELAARRVKGKVIVVP